jgi:hypothetical protein
MNRISWIVLCTLMVSLSGYAQQEEKSVKEVVERLFKGMQLGDSAMVRTTFHKNVTLATALRNRENVPVLRRETSIDAFLKAIGSPHPEPWNEEIWDVEVKVDGDFAQVWCDYAFYVGKNFSHCGIDSFHLHKGADGWKIFHLADTRKTTDCQIPKDIVEKYK